MSSLPIKIYGLPYGYVDETHITNVYPDDCEYFIQNNIAVSMESLGGDIVIYGCPKSDITEESEVIVMAGDRSCEEALKNLAEECKKAFGEMK